MLLLRPAVYSVENLHNNDVREGSTSTGIEQWRVTKWSAISTHGSAIVHHIK
jgi:hypothetical protein